MPTLHVNDVEIFYEISGSGETPLALVHGSWFSHRTWDAVVTSLEESFTVLTYDRRGHSESQCPPGQGSIREDVADLAALLEHLGLSRAWVVANSMGACIALRLAGEHPQLLKGLVCHEPPLFSLIEDDPAARPILEELNRRLPALAQRVVAGDHAGAAEQFVDTVVLGPGAWAELEPAVQQTCIENAPTFLDEMQDPEGFSIEPTSIDTFPRPVLLTIGDQSPPMFAPVVAQLSEILPNAEIIRFPDAGHLPHETHPKMYAETIMAFIDENST